MDMKHKNKNLCAGLLIAAGLFICGGATAIHKSAAATAETPLVNGTFVMDDGVSLKLNDDGGMRFIVKMDETVKRFIVDDDAENQVKLSFIIAPTQLMAVAENDYLNMSQNLVREVDDETKIYQDEDGFWYANCCIVKMYEQNRTYDFSAVACIQQGDSVQYTPLNDNARGNLYNVVNASFLNGYAGEIASLSSYEWYGQESYPIRLTTDGQYDALVDLVNGGLNLSGVYAEAECGVSTTKSFTDESAPPEIFTAHNYEIAKSGKYSVYACSDCGETLNVATDYIHLDLIGGTESPLALGENATTAIDLSGAGVSKITSVTCGEKELFVRNLGGGVGLVELSLDDVKTVYGAQTLLINGSVSYPVTFVSKVIKTVEDYNNWGVIAKACESSATVYGGYFELGNNISDPSGDGIDINAFNNANPRASSYVTIDGKGGFAGNEAEGFAGTFDGCGYVIDGLTSDKNSNQETFIGALLPTGVLKNIGFTNVSMLGCNDGGNVFLTTTYFGTLENIYVHYKEINEEGGRDGEYTTEDSTLAISAYHATVTITHVFVDASAASCNYGFAILGNDLCEGKITDVYGIFYKGYNSSVSQFSNWNSPVTQGFATPAALKANANAWAAVQQFAEDCEYWHVDEKTGKVTFERRETIDVQSVLRIELDINNDGTLNETKVIDLGLDSVIDGEYTVISVNGTPVSDNLIPVSVFGYAYGNQTVTARVETSERVYTVNIPVLLVSKVIKTVEDYQAWGVIAKACESSPTMYGGYFELGNNISDPSGSIAINAFNTQENKGSWGTGGFIGDATKGFAGTFDGCGYVIDGLTSDKTSNLETFIGAMTPEGVLRNIGFTNVSMLGCADGGNVLLTNTFYGTLENIYVHYKEIVSVAYDKETASKDGTVAINSALGELKVVHLFVDASGVMCEEDLYGFGILGTEQCIDKTTDTYGIFYGNYQRTVSQFTSWTVPTNQQGFASYTALKANADAWAAVQQFAKDCEYWHVDKETGKVTFGRES